MSVLTMELKDFAGRKITFEQLSRRSRRILAERSRNRSMDVLNEGAKNIRNTIIQGMRDSPPTGKLYFRTKAKKKHRASAPGNYPRVDSGALVQSIGIDARLFEVEVGSRITSPAYPKWLEKGTDKMEPRPWLDRSLQAHDTEIKRDIMEVLRRSAREFKGGL